jgi:Dullard-like phosphatase family protein
MESRIKNYVKKKEKLKHKETKEKESFPKIQKLPNTKIKKEKNITEKDKLKKEENLKAQRNSKSNNKLISGLLSDSETIKTETTRGDTLIDNNKYKYVYKKNINKKNYSFAIKNLMTNKNNKNVPMSPSNNEKKLNKLNCSTSLNKYLKENKSNENILNTNQYFYRKKSNLLENYRTANLVKYYENFNTYNEKSPKFYENEINNNNNKSFYFDFRESKKREEFINIEDLLILEEKFSDVLISVKSKNNTPNECFELLNSYQQSSVYNNFENYFNSIESKNIVHSSIMYLIYDVIICYHFSFDSPFFDTCYKYLENILEINHKTFLLLCNIISNKISSSSIDNIWVDKLRQMLKENLIHIELNNKEYISFLMEHKNINFKNPTSSDLLEIKFYTMKIEKYLELFLNTIPNTNPLKVEFYSLFENLFAISADKLLHFFKSKIIRVINQNASVAGIESISDIDNNKVEVPYLKNKCPKKFSLVLDLDETLISFKLEPGDENKGTIRFRPYLDSFLQKVKEKYEIIVFTSGTKDYADPLEDAIEQEENYFDARLYRQHTVVYGKDIVKDISRIGRPLDKICIVENMPQNYRLQKENGILIKSFYGDDIYDTALVSLGDILIKISNEFDDIRKGIAKYKNQILNNVTSNLSKKK